MNGESKLSQSEFLALFPDTRHRYIYDDKGALPEGFPAAMQGTNELDLSWNKKGYGTFFTVNGFPPEGKANESRLLSLNGNYVDFDTDPALPQEEREKLIQAAIMRGVEAGIPTPTLITRTWKGVHMIWLYPEKLAPTPENIAKWRTLQNRLVHFYGGDAQCKDPSRILRVPGTLHLKDPKNPFEIYVMSYKPQSRPTFDELDNEVPQYSEVEIDAKKLPMNKVLAGLPVGHGVRHIGIAQVAGRYLHGARTPEEIEMARIATYAWDKEKNKSPEPEADRKREIDNVIDGLAAKELKKMEEDPQRYQTLLDAIPQDTPKESLMMALTPLLEALAVGKDLADAEIYVRNKVKDALGISSKDMDAIVRHFKGLRTRILERQAAEKKKAEQLQIDAPLSEAETLAAEAVVKSPTFLYDVLQMVKKLGVVGEEKNVLLHYLILTSRKLDRPLSATVKGDSAAGKSHTLLTPLKMFPKSAYIDLTDATPQSFFYTPEGYFKHRIVIIFEKHGGERADYTIRTLQSEGKLKIQVTIKNPDTGQFEAQTIEKEGPTGFITTTTASVIHAENDTRNISMFPDQSAEQTVRVYESVDARYRGIRTPGDAELKPWRDAQIILKPLPVQIPFAAGFRKYFPSHIVRTRRDYGHFLAIVETSALLHQMQRNRVEIDGQEYIRATLADAHIAKVIVEESLSKSIHELPEKAIEVIEAAQLVITEMQDKGVQENKQIFTVSGLSKGLGWDRDTVAKWMKPALKKGYFTVTQESKGSKGTEYKLEEKELPGDTFLPSIHDLIADHPEESMEGIYDPITGQTGLPEIELSPPSTDVPTAKEVGENTQPRSPDANLLGPSKGIGASVQDDWGLFTPKTAQNSLDDDEELASLAASMPDAELAENQEDENDGLGGVI